MMALHECEVCGMYCDCDGEDMHNPQPRNCEHLSRDCTAEYDDDPVDDGEPSK